jgi:hypothetical protein
MKKFVAFIIIVTFSFNTSIFGQEMKKGIEYKFDIKKVLEEKEIVYYGWDFSSFKITDIKKLPQGPLMLYQYIPEWLALLNERYTSNVIARNFEKKVYVNLVSVQERIKQSKPDSIVTMQTYEIHIDTIKNIVKSYNLPEKSGVGLVFITESFNKPQNYVTGYVTFFDIESKELLWSVKMKGLPGSKWGFTKYVYEGFVEIYDYYLRGYYNRDI